MENRIGVFDSGLGGLTVVKEIRRLMPQESVVYFGDTARVPYGTKSKETVVRFSSQIVEFLIESDVKYVVAACNTASALALENLKKKYKVPIMGVILPGAKAAAERTRNGRIGVIATPATVRSGAYEREIKRILPGAVVFSNAATLLVPLVEEKGVSGKILRDVIEMYLSKMLKKRIDTLILGCTHYPIIKKHIESVTGKTVTIIDSALESAKMLQYEFNNRKMFNETGKSLDDLFYVTDSPDRFRDSGSRFLKSPIKNIKQIRMDY